MNIDIIELDLRLYANYDCTYELHEAFYQAVNYPNKFTDYCSDEIFNNISRKQQVDKILSEMTEYERNVLYSVFLYPERNYNQIVLKSLGNLTGPAYLSPKITSIQHLIDLCSTNDPELEEIKMSSQNIYQLTLNKYLSLREKHVK